ncbi:MAG: galactose-binding domain-containing protein, partial [Planctomycetota bacterium]
ATTHPLDIQFDNTVAGLTLGQTATGLLTIVWDKLDGSTDQEPFPIKASVTSTEEWDGGGGDDNWSTDLNWADDTAPVPGSNTVLQFAGATRTSPNNDFAAASDFSSILFNPGTSEFTLGGNAFGLFSMVKNDSVIPQTINNDMTLGAVVSVDAEGGDVTLGGTVSGGFGLAKIGVHTLALNGANTYSGETTIDEGRLVVNGSIDTSSQVTVNAGGTLSGSGSTPLVVVDGTIDPARETVVTGQVVRIRVPGSEALSLAEVQVFSNGVNVAPEGTASHDPPWTTNDIAPAARAIDGNTDGIFGNGSVTHTSPSTGTWWQVDLGGDVGIDEIRIWNRTDCCSERLDDYTIEVFDSASNVVWRRGPNPYPSVLASHPIDTIGILTTEGIDLEAGGTLRLDFGDVSGVAGTNWDLVDASAAAGTIENNVGGGSAFTIELHDDLLSGFEQTGNYTWTIIQGASVTDFEANDFTVDASDWPAYFGVFAVEMLGNNLVLGYSLPATYEWDAGNGTASDAEREWVAGSGANWTADTLPTATDTAYINGNHTAVVANAGARANTLFVGDDDIPFSGGNPTGHVEQTGGDLLLGSVLQLGDDPGTKGTYSISGGTLANTNWMRVGGAGIAEMTISGVSTVRNDYVNNGAFAIGHRPGSVGTVTIHNGLLEASSEIRIGDG